MSNVQAFVSAHCESVVQHAGFDWKCTHVPVGTSQRSVVQAFASLHCAFVVQQPACGACTQWCVASQLSAVQVLPSLHCAAVVQHPAIAACTHVRFATLQTSLVQAFASSQSVFAVQQPGIGVFTQIPGVPPDVSQVSVVQTFASEHWAALVQLVAAWRTEPVSRSGSAAEPQRTVPRARKAPTMSDVFFNMCPLVERNRRAAEAA